MKQDVFFDPLNEGLKINMLLTFSPIYYISDKPIIALLLGPEPVKRPSTNAIRAKLPIRRILEPMRHRDPGAIAYAL